MFRQDDCSYASSRACAWCCREANANLRKQLETCKTTLRTKEQESRRQLQVMENRIRSVSPTSKQATNTSSARKTSPARNRSSRDYNIISNQSDIAAGLQLQELINRLSMEEDRTASLQKQVDEMEQERKQLLDGWNDIKERVIK